MPALSQEQIALRQTFIGGSDAASICGVNPYKTAHDVYLEKIGQGKPIVETEAMRWGTLHEDTIAREYAYRTGRTISVDERSLTCRDYSYMGCHVDRIQLDRAVPPQGILEVKTTRSSLKKGECPDRYTIQLYHNLICTDLKWGTVAILIQGSELVWYDFHLTDAIKSRIVAIESRFWKAVQAKDWSLFGCD
jgi:putative phage-type endonuclease